MVRSGFLCGAFLTKKTRPHHGKRDAAVFLDWVEDLTSSPENLGLSGPKTKLKLQGKRKDKVDKVEISRPCGFRHNVSISMEDRDTFYSMMVNINAVTDVNKL